MTKYTLKGWDIKKFIVGRKKLIVTMVGAIAGWVITQNPALTAIIATGTELIYAVLEYYVKE